MTDDIPPPQPLEELNDDERRLLDFTVRFDCDPVGVALIFAGLALACASRDMPVQADEIITALEAAGEELEVPALETLLALSPLVKTTIDNDEDRAESDSPWRFYLHREERRELILVGAQRWIETQLNRTRTPPPPACASRDEIKAAVARHPRASVNTIMDMVGGEGLLPLFVFRATVAEELLAVALARENQLSIELGQALEKIQRYHGELRALAAGLDEL